jgi:hypothetical protein
MKIFDIFYKATVVALGSAVGCGGTALTSQGDAGSLAACGGNCSPAQVSAACSAVCGRIAQTGCPISTGCGCSALPSMTPSCLAVAAGFFRCVEASPPACSDSGSVQFLGCDPQEQALIDCLPDSGATGATSSSQPATSGNGPPSGPFGGSCGNVPANVCPNIPRPVGGAGASSCSGGGGGGPTGTTTSQTSCQDSAGNVWQAECAGSTCTCAYNGGQACTCTITGDAGSCSSCCPGTG